MNNKQYKELDEIGEEKLWDKYIKKKEQKVRDYFVIKYAPLVKYVAGKVSMGMPQNIEFDDLVSYGIFGLIDAINKFDPSRGIKFKTYAMTRIRGAIFDELRSIDWIPRSIRQKAKQVEQVISDLEKAKEAVQKFAEVLRHGGVKVTVRKSRGLDADAACGQLSQRTGASES